MKGNRADNRKNPAEVVMNPAEFGQNPANRFFTRGNNSLFKKEKSDPFIFYIKIREEHEMRLIVNRFEGDMAVCERSDQSMVDIEIGKLPSDVKTGDVLIEKDGKYELDLTQTEKREKCVQALMDDLVE